jgi:DNA mismatch repair protein MutS
MIYKRWVWVTEEIMAHYTPMIQQYLAIKETVPDAFLFFRLGDFYEMFFDDAVKASRELGITLTGREGGAEEKIPMCGVPYHSANNYILKLIDKGYKVAICEQVEDPAAAKGVVKREIVRIVTPGTVLEGKMIDDKRNQFIVAACRTIDHYALAACDLTTGEFLTHELEPNLHSLIEEIDYLEPSEILLDSGSIMPDEVLELKQRFAVPSSTIPYIDKAQVPTYITESKVELTDVMQHACRFLYQYLGDTQKRVLPHLQSIQAVPARHSLVLDSFTRRNLELAETLRDKAKKGSLLSLLDQTHTAMGGRLLRKWLEKPLQYKSLIDKRLEAVGTFYEDLILRDEVIQSLKEVYDIERLIARIAYGNAGPKDVVALKHSLDHVPNLAELCINSSSDTLRSLFQNLNLCRSLAEFIGQALVDNPPALMKDGGFIRPGFEAALDRYREARTEGTNWIAALEQKERTETGIKSLKIGYNKVFGYFIEVTKSNLTSLSEGRYERKQTLANAERFITPELKQYETLILEAEEKMLELELSLFQNIRQKIIGEMNEIQGLAKRIAEVDVYQSLAQVAVQNHFTKPIVFDGFDLKIKRGRHPVVESVLEDVSFIANSSEMDANRRVMLITGPNMAGKSTYMRQVALIVLMAHMGSFVPADEAVIPIIDRVFTRIGAADDLVGGQSTFMVEMKDIQTMALHATARSLVIIDELGRGTSTEEGMAIAQSVIEYLHDHIRCKTLVSTHFHELSHLEQGLSCLRNYSMAVKENDDNVTFLRQLVPGAASKSYGIYCAKIAGLPESIIARSEALLLNGLVKEEVATTRQLSLFGDDLPLNSKVNGTPLTKGEKEVLARLDDVDPMNVTPLQAIQILMELKQKQKSKS